jgi:hypothetical protein
VLYLLNYSVQCIATATPILLQTGMDLLLYWEEPCSEPFLRTIPFQAGAMKRSLRSVDSTGDTVTFASQLSTSFFSALSEACLTFGTLFEEHYAKPEILNLLLGWVQKQVALYVEILIPQVSVNCVNLFVVSRVCNTL